MAQSKGWTRAGRGLVVLALWAGTILAPLASPGATALPPPRKFGASIDPWPAKDLQDSCESSEKPGTQALRDLLLAAYPGTSNGGITRSCADYRCVAFKSEHCEGRAWDWTIPFSKRQAGDEVISWLRTTDEYGNECAMARRLGVMYAMWQGKIYRFYNLERCRQAPGSAEDHFDHVHFSLSWAGAGKTTSYWTASGAAPPMVGMTRTVGGDGYWLVASDGGVFSFNSEFHGSSANIALRCPMVGMDEHPSGRGYWLVACDGGVFAHGDIPYHGSVPQLGISIYNVVDMRSTWYGNGYWLFAADGGVFAFGDAPFHGSMGGQTLNKPPVVGGDRVGSFDCGYWLAAADGGVFSFGCAPFYGSMGGQTLAAPVVGIASHPFGCGYWLAAADGGVFSFGCAPFLGSMGSTPLAAPVVGIEATPNGKGYWLVARDGGVFAFGEAAFHGSRAGAQPGEPSTEKAL